MGSSTTPEALVRQKALSLLARREHSTLELSRKLVAKGIEQGLAAAVVSQLHQKDLVSDARFTEGFVRWRMTNGYGPIRIRHELRERGINEDMAARYLPRDEEQWLDSIAKVKHKRFGETKPADYRDRARQMRFLMYRGFTSEQIRKVLG
ncbi:MAG: regulatory protein RecX [Gammaproteobacteria bacterium]|nr:regulatory protein RecX [Gammaproteobacteria bacterium]